MRIYGALHDYTIVLKSTSSANKTLPLCMGVYRLIGRYDNRPLYKQDGGEHYLYHNKTFGAWMVGPQIGKNYGWLRKQREGRNGSVSTSDGSSDEDEDRIAPRLLPEDLSGGWQYQQLGGNDEDDDGLAWLSDDQTLKVEPLRGKFLINVSALFA